MLTAKSVVIFLSINREMKVTESRRYYKQILYSPLIVLISIQAHLLSSITRNIYMFANKDIKLLVTNTIQAFNSMKKLLFWVIHN